MVNCESFNNSRAFFSACARNISGSIATKLTNGPLIGPAGLQYVPIEPEILRAQAEKKARELLNDSQFTIKLDEYSLARNVQSENATGTVIEQVLTAQAIISAKGNLTVTQKLTNRKNYNGGPPLRPQSGHYGEQKGRYASSRFDPTLKSLYIARAVLQNLVDFIVPDAAPTDQTD